MTWGRDLNVGLVRGQEVEAPPDSYTPAVITQAGSICWCPVDEALESRVSTVPNNKSRNTSAVISD